MTASAERATMPPGPPDWSDVLRELSGLGARLESIQTLVMRIPELVSAVQSLETQHSETLNGLAEARGAANLAGGMAALALEGTERTETALHGIRSQLDRIEGVVSSLAQTSRGLVEHSRTVHETMFPIHEPDSSPSIEFDDSYPHRRPNTGT